MDGREAHVDLAQVLLEHARAQRIGQCRAHRLGEVAAHIVDRVVGGHGQQGGGGLLGVPAEGGDVRGEVGGDLDGRTVGAVGEPPLRLSGGHLDEAVDGLLVQVKQRLRELRAHLQLGLLAVRGGGRGALVLVHHGGGDLVEIVARVEERPGHVAGVDQGDRGEAGDEQGRDRLLPLSRQQRHEPATESGESWPRRRSRRPSPRGRGRARRTWRVRPRRRWRAVHEGGTSQRTRYIRVSRGVTG